MIRFRPRDIGMWRDKFNFPFNLLPKMISLPDFKEFDDPQEFLQFLIENNVRLNDPNHKLNFPKLSTSNHTDYLGGLRLANLNLANDTVAVYDVHRWTVIGWVEVSSTSIIERLEQMLKSYEQNL